MRLFLLCSVLLTFSSFACAMVQKSFNPYLWQMTHKESAISADQLCPEIDPPFVEKMHFNSKFKDSSKDESSLDQSALQTYEVAIKRIRSLEATTIKYANLYLQTGQLYFRQCVIDWLSHWAKAQAMLDTTANATGQFVRKWALASTALAALQISQGGQALPLDIQQWLRRLMQQVVTDFNLRPIEKHNNHDYWAAWAVALSAVLLEDQQAYHWALKQWSIGIENIDHGFLAKELARKSRALEYHNYALQALFFIADLACEQGQPALLQHPKLHQLVKSVAQGMADPERFAKKTGYTQHTKKLYSKTNMAWWHRYRARFAYRFVDIDQFLYVWPKANRLGGDLSLLRPPSTCVAQ